MNVIEFPRPEAPDIPAQLREIADRLEAADDKPVAIIGLLETEGAFGPILLGALDDVRALGLLVILQQLMSELTLGDV